MRRRRLARRLRAPDPAIRMIERRLRAQLESAPGSALAVVTMGAPEPAALGVGALALDLSSEGRRVVVVDASDSRPLASMLGLSPTSDTMEMFPVPMDESSSLRLLVAPPDPMQMAEKPPPDDTDALLVLAALDPAFGAEHLAPWVSDAVMLLSSQGRHPGSHGCRPGDVAPGRDLPALRHPLGFRSRGREFRSAQP